MRVGDLLALLVFAAMLGWYMRGGVNRMERRIAFLEGLEVDREFKDYRESKPEPKPEAVET